MTRIDRRHGAFLVQRYVPAPPARRAGPAPASATAGIKV